MTKLNYAQEIIDYCKKNRISSTQVADALGKTGVLPNIKPLNLDHHKVGLVRCIFTAFDSNYQLHDEIQEINEDEVALIFCHELKEQAVLGELVSKYCLYYKMKVSVNQKCIFAFIAGILVCCMYKHYKNNPVNGMKNLQMVPKQERVNDSVVGITSSITHLGADFIP